MPIAADPEDTRTDLEDEPISRVSLRLPQSVKTKVDEMAGADGISTNAWLIRAVMDALAERPGSRGWPQPPRTPPFFGPEGPFGPHGVFGQHGPFGSGGPFGDKAAQRKDEGTAPTRQRPGLGPMTFRNEVFDGVRHVVVDNFGAGSITVEPGPSPDAVEASINAADERFLDQVQLRHEHGELRISMPPLFFRSSSAHLRLGVPDGLTFVVRAASADVSVSAAIGRSKILSGSGDSLSGRPRISSVPPDRATSVSSGSRAAVPGSAPVRGRSRSPRPSARSRPSPARATSW